MSIAEDISLAEGRVLDVTGLPPKPEPTIEGAPVRWVELLYDKPLSYKGKTIEIGSKHLDALVKAFREMTALGYRPPQLAEHVANGERLGHLLDMQVWPDSRRGGRPTLIGALQFNDEGAEDKIAREIIYAFSPRLGSVEHDGTGKVWPMAIKEVSRVSAPHRKTRTHILGAEHDGGAMSTQLMDGAPPEQPEEGTGGEDRYAALDKRMGEMEGKLDTLMGEVSGLADSMKKMMEVEISDESEEEPDVTAMCGPDGKRKPEMMAMEQEAIALREQVASLKQEVALSEVRAWQAENRGSSVCLSEVDPAALATLKTSAPDLWATLSGSAVKADPTTTPATSKTPPPTGAPKPPAGFDVVLGEGGDGVEPREEKTITASEIKREAEASGVDRFDVNLKYRRAGYTVLNA